MRLPARRLFVFGLLGALVAGGPRLSAGEPQTAVPVDPLSLPAESAEPTHDLTRSYHGLFLAFATGDREAAIERTMAFERATLAAEPKKGFEKLSEADSRLFAAIERQRPQALLALTPFYRDLAHRYSLEHDFGLLMRANRATEELLQRMVQPKSDAFERRVVASAYESLALDLINIFATARAAEMLESALKLAPKDVPANIALSTLLLRDERYAAAVLHLDRALAVAPENREAALRRAVLRARTDFDARAARELEALAASPEPDWITVLALQERGRGLIAKGRFGDAIAWFERAAERFPKESSFPAAIAFCQHRAGLREAASTTALGALNRTGSGDTGARRRYAALPVELLEPRRGETNLAAEARREELQSALRSISDSLL